MSRDTIRLLEGSNAGQWREATATFVSSPGPYAKVLQDVAITGASGYALAIDSAGRASVLIANTITEPIPVAPVAADLVDTPAPQNVAIGLSEVSFVLPSGTKAVNLRTVDYSAFRIAFGVGETTSGPYLSTPRGNSRDLPSLGLTSPLTIYVLGTTVTTLEIDAWS